jgi:hypothetical protein
VWSASTSQVACECAGIHWRCVSLRNILLVVIAPLVLRSCAPILVRRRYICPSGHMYNYPTPIQYLLDNRPERYRRSQPLLQLRLARRILQWLTNPTRAGDAMPWWRLQFSGSPPLCQGLRFHCACVVVPPCSISCSLELTAVSSIYAATRSPSRRHSLYLCNMGTN